MGKLLNIKELSEFIGFSPRTIYDWVHVGFIPHYKFPKGVRFKESEVVKWIEKRKNKGRSLYRILTENI